MVYYVVAKKPNVVFYVVAKKPHVVYYVVAKKPLVVNYVDVVYYVVAKKPQVVNYMVAKEPHVVCYVIAPMPSNPIVHHHYEKYVSSKEILNINSGQSPSCKQSVHVQLSKVWCAGCLTLHTCWF